MAALHRAGYANRDTSQRPDDGLVLRDVYIAAAVRCAPPQNKPTPGEVTACLDHLDAEMTALPRLDTVVALGKIAWDAWLQLAARHVTLPRPRPAFGHGTTTRLAAGALPATLVGCYHPSRQNTNTGKVTPAMYDAVFQSLGHASSTDSTRGNGPGR
jgi:uracil-DNA glycosylase family 4